MGGVIVPCLVDTGSMVTTITESIFKEKFELWGGDKLKSCNWLQLTAANGLDIPYVGYFELDVEVLGKVIQKRGVLVVKDTVNPKLGVSGILGMNVIKGCYEKLFGEYGPSLFESSPFSRAPTQWQQALQHCHQAQIKATPSRSSTVRVRGGRVSRIPAGTMKLIPTTCSRHHVGLGTVALFEPPQSGLPAGLLASTAVVTLTHGTAYIPISHCGVF